MPVKILLCLAAVYFIIVAVSFPLHTVEYDIFSDEVKESVTIAQISDLHSYSYGKNMKTLIKAIDKANPDIIVLTGDIYEDGSNNDNTRKLLKNIGAGYSCFYITGNHELRTPLWKEYKAEAESYGINVMEGDVLDICGISLCGASPSADGKTDQAESIEKCAQKTEGYSVLLSHYPEDIKYYRSFGCFDLILSGHAHGGQWRIPFLENGVFSPGEGFFPEYAGGRYDFDDCTMIVSRGLKRDMVPIARLFNNPELVVINIYPE